MNGPILAAAAIVTLTAASLLAGPAPSATARPLTLHVAFLPRAL